MTKTMNILMNWNHKNLFFGAVGLLMILSLVANNSLNTTFNTKYLEFNIVDTKNEEDNEIYAIFYHAFINPANIYLSLGIISEQLMQWQESRHANATLYYTLLGDSSATFPCPKKENCKLLTRKSDGWEEDTLSKLQEYCQQHPDHNVIYLHSKETYTSNALNNRL
jgi:hypothetical protein